MVEDDHDVELSQSAGLPKENYDLLFKIQTQILQPAEQVTG